MRKYQSADLSEMYMMECLALAMKGRGRVSPNPLVGAVLVREGRVVGRGFHKTFGGPHAEVHAIREAGRMSKGASLYVNLEPCNHYGKTPPCTDLIIESGISEVVVGTSDPNPRVSGRGFKALRRAGVKVRAGILAEECARLNESFFKHVRTGIPFVAIKVAQTLDGKIADSQGTSKWITARNARKKVHGLRSTYDAVLVGAGTVRNDNPRLTVRLVKGRNPLRVILEGRSAIRSNARVFSKNARTLVFTASKRRPVKYGSNVEFVEVRNSVNGLLPLKKILKDLGERGIASVLVEGGAMIFSEFLAQGLVDRIYCFVAPCVMGKGLDAFHHIANRTIKRTIDLESVAASMAGQDLLVQALVRKR